MSSTMIGVTGERVVVTVVVTTTVEEMVDTAVGGMIVSGEDETMARTLMMTDEVVTKTDLVVMMTGEASATGMDTVVIAMEVAVTTIVDAIVESGTMAAEMEVEITEMTV